MADILIKGMEMPKCCDECPMSQLINHNQYAYCNLLMKGTKAGYMLKDCPLVEIKQAPFLEDAKSAYVSGHNLYIHKEKEYGRT